MRRCLLLLLMAISLTAFADEPVSDFDLGPYPSSANPAPKPAENLTCAKDQTSDACLKYRKERTDINRHHHKREHLIRY